MTQVKGDEAFCSEMSPDFGLRAKLVNDSRCGKAYLEPKRRDSMHQFVDCGAIRDKKEELNRSSDRDQIIQERPDIEDTNNINKPRQREREIMLISTITDKQQMNPCLHANEHLPIISPPPSQFM